MANFSIDHQLNDLAIQKSYIVDMMFSPNAWASATNSACIWHETDFPPAPRNLIPKRSGVYAFVVAPNKFNLDSASGLFYVGKTTNLYSRIGSYMNEIGKNFRTSKRPQIWRMINQWNGYLRYYYTETQDEKEAKILEGEILKAFRPHFNKSYDAETSQTMRAF